ncbi:MAG: single-stranded-DNA-specific exonuclease RecJ [Treponema sp.]|nr:single-stranded-DNA-specific exonuclease RecJ [Treponema sp.]
MKWEKKEVAPELVKDIAARYNCDLLTASIFARRGICGGESIRYFLENDLLHLRNPFAMPGMEEAVERILAAKDEGEKVLVFGDRDVDGITGTALLTGCLESLGIEVSWRIPAEDEPYGLSFKAVEEFSAADGTLIITVDCGISQLAEIKSAGEKYVDVIVTDHHEPQEELPEAMVILNPKLKDSAYPFRDLSGCGVVFKLVSALRFANKSELYGQPVSLLNTRPVNDAWIVEIAKMRNLLVVDTLVETIVPGMVSISDTRIPSFLEGQQILVWDAQLVTRTFTKLFGQGVSVGMLDIAPQVGREIPQVSGQSLLRIKELSKIARYSEKELTELDVLINLFTSYVRSREKNKEDSAREKENLQLAAIGTIGDVMPLIDENRILVRKGLEALAIKPIPGISELLYKLEMAGRPFDAKDISWKLSPVINAARRMGMPEVAAALFFEKDPKKRNSLASELVKLNDKRRLLEEENWCISEPMAYKSFSDYGEKLAVVHGEEINKGVAGLMAQRMARRFNVPAIAVSFNGDTCTGSIRSARGFNACALLEQCGDLFLDCGGHQAAAGFTMERKNWDSLLERLKTAAQSIEFAEGDGEQTIQIDAELPPEYLSLDIFRLVDRFEPYGKNNDPLNFLARNMSIREINFIGKPDSKHLKMTLEAGKHKWPALYWQAADKVLNKEFGPGDKVDAVFNFSRDYYKGNETPQMLIIDLRKSG